MFRPVPQWRNGRRGRLKICCLQGRAGSSPAWGTNNFSSELEARLSASALDLKLHILRSQMHHAGERVIGDLVLMPQTLDPGCRHRMIVVDRAAGDPDGPD